MMQDNIDRMNNNVTEIKLTYSIFAFYNLVNKLQTIFLYQFFICFDFFYLTLKVNLQKYSTNIFIVIFTVQNDIK